MPREQIQFPRRYEDLSEGANQPDTIEQARPAPVLHVHWHPEPMSGWIQVSLECDKVWLKQLIKDTMSVPPSSGGIDSTSTVSIFSEVLDRGEANRAIRFLRRARDAAYGRDE